MRQFMFSFKGFRAPDAILEGVRSGEISSFCLFAHQNVESLRQLRILTESLYEAAAAGGHPPPLIGIDQEGGQLIAVTKGATELPGNMALGATRSLELAEKAGGVLGRELLALGINLNFAPAVDVNITYTNPAIGIRSFGEDPQAVAAMGAAMIKGMQNEGILACAKHFPGQGDAARDTHNSDAIYSHPLSRLEAVELIPFRRAI
ncbi:MAG TPA: glycoside hydrolase family 3 N-terminal domain-containing protein, partial [Aggregatilineales bacterium]|nr:glycoside hydrolase family 3 N-terminal domain-containing protein [Aggregatilineales bacterium]